MLLVDCAWRMKRKERTQKSPNCLSLLSGRVNEVKFTEEEQSGGRTDFFMREEGRKEIFKFYLNILNYIMPT